MPWARRLASSKASACDWYGHIRIPPKAGPSVVSWIEIMAPELTTGIVALQDFLVAFHWYFCNVHGDAPLRLVCSVMEPRHLHGGMRARHCQQTTRHACEMSSNVIKMQSKKHASRRLHTGRSAYNTIRGATSGSWGGSVRGKLEPC